MRLVLVQLWFGVDETEIVTGLMNTEATLIARETTQRRQRETLEANRFHVVKLILLDGVQLLPQATFRTFLSHHLQVLEHTGDDLHSVTSYYVTSQHVT